MGTRWGEGALTVGTVRDRRDLGFRRQDHPADDGAQVVRETVRCEPVHQVHVVQLAMRLRPARAHPRTLKKRQLKIRTPSAFYSGKISTFWRIFFVC